MYRGASIKLFPICLFILCLAACTGGTTKKNTGDAEGSSGALLEGRWRATLALTDNEKLPFNFDLVQKTDGSYEATIINAQEKIVVTDIAINKDSIIFTLPVFGSQIKGKFNDKRILGTWHNYAKGPDYQLDFYAVYGDTTRFELPLVEDNATISGRWAVMFIADDKSSKTDAIGVFEQKGQRVTGTFLTPSGDYRYLDGSVADRDLYLSCFDGAHAFLFKAYVNDDGDLQGDFWSGSHSHEVWVGYRDDTVSLPNPEKLTKLKSGNTGLAFSFPDLNGKQVSLTDETFKNKVVMVQAMGTWCPNCMDETALYTEIYKQYKDRGLEIVALAFEAADTLPKAKPALERYQKYFSLPYTLLYAGKAGKKDALQALPMLDSFSSFPTTIFIDRKGKVRKIHTGFSGPATGKEYQDYVTELNAFLNMLLSESI